MRPPHRDVDVRHVVVVPARPGPLVRLVGDERQRDEMDEALDEVFGAPDDRGPSATDALLVVGGTAAVVAGQLASWPTIVTVVGVGAVLLGLILPARSLWRRLTGIRQATRLAALVGDGTLLRTDQRATSELVAAHTRVLAAVAPRSAALVTRVNDVAHAALAEVATLLDGRVPVGVAEMEYVEARTAALEELAATLADPQVPDGDDEHRRAIVEARREIEDLGGTSSVSTAAELRRDLLGEHG